MSDDPRIELLEIKVAHLEQAVQELSDVLYRQQAMMDAHEVRYRRLMERVDASERQAGGDAQFEIPPHY